jgi:hypothetical protein
MIRVRLRPSGYRLQRKLIYKKSPKVIASIHTNQIRILNSRNYSQPVIQNTYNVSLTKLHRNFFGQSQKNTQIKISSIGGSYRYVLGSRSLYSKVSIKKSRQNIQFQKFDLNSSEKKYSEFSNKITNTIKQEFKTFQRKQVSFYRKTQRIFSHTSITGKANKFVHKTIHFSDNASKVSTGNVLYNTKNNFKFETHKKNNFQLLEKQVLQKMESNFLNFKQEIYQQNAIQVVEQLRNQISLRSGEIAKDVLKELQRSSRIDSLRRGF